MPARRATAARALFVAKGPISAHMPQKMASNRQNPSYPALAIATATGHERPAPKGVAGGCWWRGWSKLGELEPMRGSAVIAAPLRRCRASYGAGGCSAVFFARPGAMAAAVAGPV